MKNLINCGTCGYPLTPEERTSLIERDGVMVKPAPVQEPPVFGPPIGVLMKMEGDETRKLYPLKQKPAPVQEPVAWVTGFYAGRCVIKTINPAAILPVGVALYTTPPAQPAPVQEPVALEAVYETIIQWDEGGGKRSRRELARRIVDLYTTPPAAQRQWVGLTDEEIDLFINGRGDEDDDDYVEPTGDGFGLTDADLVKLVRRAEAKLRSQNT
jgi:hypothetical protein